MKIRVAAIVIRDDRILLVKHRRRGLSYWAFPGGSVQEGETLTDALKRELIEEAGLDISPRRLLYVVDTVSTQRMGAHTVNLFFLVDVVGEIGNLSGEHTPGEHLDVAEFVALETLPDLDLYPDISEQVRRAYENHFPCEEGVYLGNLWSEEKAT